MPLHRKFINKRFNAKKEGILFLLTQEEVQRLLDEACISWDQWTHKGYHLARYNDSGPYEVGNCRFITANENYQEKSISEKSRKASKNNVEKATERNREIWANPETAEKYRKLFREKVKFRPSFQPKPAEYYLDQWNKIKHIDFSIWGATKKAANILGCSHTQIKRLRNRFSG